MALSDNVKYMPGKIWRTQGISLCQECLIKGGDVFTQKPNAFIAYLKFKYLYWTCDFEVIYLRHKFKCVSPVSSYSELNLRYICKIQVFSWPLGCFVTRYHFSQWCGIVSMMVWIPILPLLGSVIFSKCVWKNKMKPLKGYWCFQH